MKPIAIVATVSICAGIAHADATPGPVPVPTTTEEPETVVAVTPTRRVEPVATANSAVTVITRQQIEAKKPFDITDVLSMAPGVNVAQNGDPGQVTSVFMRGATPESTLVLVDGMRVNSPSTGEFDFGTLPVSNIDHIEILRGPQSALYGADASGGVINIVTRRGEGAFRTGGDLEFGNYNVNREEFTARGEVSGGGLSFAVTRLSDGGYFANDDARSISSSLRYDHPLSPHSNLTFTGQAEDANVGEPGQKIPAFASFDPTERERPNDVLGTLRFTNTSGNRQDSLSGGIYDRVLHDDDPLNKLLNRTEDRVYSLEGQSSWTGRSQTLTTGFEARREKTDQLTNYSSPFEQGFTTTALFAQDELRCGRFSLTPGVRAESNSQFGSAITGRVTGGYELNAVSRLKGSIGTGFNAPTFQDLYQNFPGFIVANPNLHPEKSTGYDFGYVRTLPRDGELDVTLFHNRFRGLIADQPIPGTFMEIPENVQHATTHGVEIGLSQPLGRDWKLALNQTFTSTGSDAPAPLVRRPAFNTSADAIYRHNRLSFDFGVLAEGRRFDFGPGPTFAEQQYGSFTRLDLTVSYKLAATRQVYLRVRNLGDVHYQEVSGFPAMGANFVVGYQVGGF